MCRQKCYLIDLDGTIYRGKEPIPYAEEFIEYLNSSKRMYLMATNCPESSPKSIKEKLQHMGIYVEKENILTSGQAAAGYISGIKPDANVFVVGSEALKDELVLCGAKLVTEQPEFVVIGFDRNITYEKMERASHWIMKGAKFICTNKDTAIPQNDDLIPHTGALAAAIQAVTGVSPVYIGKPEKHMLEAALLKLGCSKDECCIIGDRLDTDILTGVRNGISSYLVLTGVTDMKMLNKSGITPTKVFRNLKEVIDFDCIEESVVIK